MAREYQNVSMSIPRFQKTKNFSNVYTKESLMEALKDVRFDRINIPLHSYRNIVVDETKRGTMVVGFIESYDEEADCFNVIVHENFADIVCDYMDPIIYPRVQVVGDKIVKILGLDICPKLYYANMR